MKCSRWLLLNFLLLIVVSAIAQQPAWTEVSPGVWKAIIGKPEAYSLLSAAGSRPLQSNMKTTSFPLAKNDINGVVKEGKTYLRFPLQKEEQLYGFGLNFQTVHQRGKILQLHVDHYGGKDNGRTHAPVPFYVSSNGYGVLINSARYLTVYAGSGVRKDAKTPAAAKDRNTDKSWSSRPYSDAVEILVPAGGVEVYVFGGPSPLDAVRRYNLFNGGGVLPPRWGLGFTQRVKSLFTAEDVKNEANAFKEKGFPLDFIGLEPGWQSKSYPGTFEWDKARYPQPQQFVKEMLDKGIRLNLWINPYVSEDAPFYKAIAPYTGSHTVWVGEVPDFTIAAARSVFFNQLKKDQVSIGVSGYKIDEVDGYDHYLWPDVATFPSGTSAEQMRQTFGVLAMRYAAEMYHEKNQRTFGLVRASNAGANNFPFVIYNDYYNHQDFITALINSGFAGVLWTPEVRASKTGEEWLRRFQSVVFSPMAMINAWSSGTKPWSYPEVAEQVKQMALLRMQMIPYWYSEFAKYHFQGTPPFRAMNLEPGFLQATKKDAVNANLEENPYAEATSKEIKDQYMAGEYLLVAPMFTGDTARKVVLPKGKWYDFYTGAYAGDGEVITVRPGLDKIPVYVKDGGIIPMMPAKLQAPKAGEKIDLEIRYYGTQPGKYSLYDDDGETFNYEKGDYSWREIKVERDAGGNLKGSISAPVSGKPNNIGNVTWKFMTATNTYNEVANTLRAHILDQAAWAMKQEPITVTAQTSSRSAGGKHDFYSEGDYWWPNPASPDSPYIQKDGMTNPDNFVAHRLAMIRLSTIVGALSSAYKLTGDEQYVRQAMKHALAWFVNADTKMNPNLLYAQAIKGRATGRGIGIIDTIHLIEVVQGLMQMQQAANADDMAAIKKWFEEYLQWLTTHQYGKDEMNAENNHGTCWVMQVAAFAKFTGNNALLDFCRERYKTVLLPNQMAADGSFPRELRRTKPYGYSIFNLDAMATICQLLNLWDYATADGKSIKKGIEYLYPYIADKSKWPHQKDVMYWDNWPVAQPFLVFGANAYNNAGWLNTWKQLDHAPTVEEIVRNVPVRNPLIWIDTTKSRDQKAIDEAVNGWWKKSMETHEARIQWWRDAKFGMFIHWGVYSLPGGEWKGRKVGGYAEHLMRKEKISRKEYLDLAHKFNPEKFNAEEWILHAKNAGMRYFIITVKHHDGFAMYDSKVSDFDIIDQSGFHRDPMAELAAAAKKHGVKFGFYYSHAFDWEHPDAPGNDWEYNNPGGDKLLGGANWYDTHPEWLPKAVNYVNEKAIPQIKELIAKYHPDILWFDTPHKLPLSENIRILKAIREADPNVVVNGRLVRNANANFGDYKNTADRPAEFYPVTGDWEAIPTTNESYGYHKFDSSHKPASFFIRLLAKAASKGGNLLMNIGPKGDGEFDIKDLKILDGIGKWMKKNSQSIYGAKASPLPLQSWGVTTQKDDKIYLHVFEWPKDGKLIVGGINGVKKAYLLDNSALTVKNFDANAIQIAVPRVAPDSINTVIVLQLNGKIVTDSIRYLAPNVKTQRLLAFDATLHGKGVSFGDGKADRYYVENWDALTWKFRTAVPGKFRVQLMFTGAGSVQLQADNQPTETVVNDKQTLSISLPAGLHEINIKPLASGIKFLELKLIAE